MDQERVRLEYFSILSFCLIHFNPRPKSTALSDGSHGNRMRMGGFDLQGQRVALQTWGWRRSRAGQPIVGGQAAMTAREAGDRVHVGVGQLLRPGRRAELAADLLLATGAGPGQQFIA